MSTRRRERVGGGRTNEGMDVAPSPAMVPASSRPMTSGRIGLRSARLSQAPSSRGGSPVAQDPPSFLVSGRRSARQSQIERPMSQGSTRISGRGGIGQQLHERPSSSLGTARNRGNIFMSMGRDSARSPNSLEETMHADPEEYLQRLQKQRGKERMRHGGTEVSQLNAYSRPMYSMHQPLRSTLLDPGVNNIPRSRAQSELRKKMKRVNMPHQSYDIDGDGYVSQEDYFLAKRFDLDGNGVLDPDEQEVGRFIMAQEFFRRHKDDAHLYGPEWSGSQIENIERLATSNTFQKMLGKLKEAEKHYRDVGSHGTTECLTMANKNLTQHNWYVDKFDTTAWNDFGANPRKYDPCGLDSAAASHGSRHKMYHLRQMKSRELCQSLLDKSDAKKKQYSNARVSLITNWAVENA